MTHKPTFSLLLIKFNVPLHSFSETLDSPALIACIYGKFDLGHNQDVICSLGKY